MVSKTSICNKALRKVGESPIMDIDTDTSDAANLCKQSYDEVLEEVLREHNWNFAIERQALVQEADNVPLYEFSYSYVLPTKPKFLKLISIENEPDYRIEKNRILTNAENLNIRYVSKVTDPNKYDTMFVNALATRLASEIAFRLTGDSRGQNLTQKLQQEYIFILSRARDIDFQEDNKKAAFQSKFNNSRLVSFERDAANFTPITEDA
jgi:hypothetical protein